jgi:hypothetical protein
MWQMSFRSMGLTLRPKCPSSSTPSPVGLGRTLRSDDFSVLPDLETLKPFHLKKLKRSRGCPRKCDFLVNCPNSSSAIALEKHN